MCFTLQLQPFSWAPPSSFPTWTDPGFNHKALYHTNISTSWFQAEADIIVALPGGETEVEDIVLFHWYPLLCC